MDSYYVILTVSDEIRDIKYYRCIRGAAALHIRAVEINIAFGGNSEKLKLYSLSHPGLIGFKMLSIPSGAIFTISRLKKVVARSSARGLSPAFLLILPNGSNIMMESATIWHSRTRLPAL
jgi:hypothetical protein